jgi:hypothetical protein
MSVFYLTKWISSKEDKKEKKPKAGGRTSRKPKAESRGKKDPGGAKKGRGAKDPGGAKKGRFYGFALMQFLTVLE